MQKTFLFISFIFLYFNVSAYVSQSNWRWRNDNGNETSATWKAKQNTSITISSLDSNIRLRIQLNNNTGSDKSLNYTLQYASSVDGPWRYITRLEGTNAFVLTNTNNYVADKTGTTQQIRGSSNTFHAGKVFVKTDELDEPILNAITSEYEWCIRPTKYIDANATYYFRIPNCDYSVVLPSLTTGNNLSIKQKAIYNGGFENYLAGWRTHVAGGAHAFFHVTDSVHHFGIKSLGVKVTQTGFSNSVILAHAPLTTNNTHTYLIRFWAKAKKDKAKLSLMLTTNTSKKYDFKLYTGWEQYQYAFKTNETSPVLSFSFQTKTEYVLDDVELLDEADASTDVEMNYMWQNKRPEDQYSWLSADGALSESLPDGRTVWTFSDGWYGYNDTTTNSMSTHQLLRNTLVVQDAPKPNGTLITKIGGAVQNPEALMRPLNPIGYDDFFWPHDMTVENDSLKILLPDIRVLNEGDPITSGNREAIGIFSLPDLTLQSIQWLPYLDSAGEYVTLCKGDDGYTYAYSSHQINSFESHAIVARFPTDNLSVTTPWEFLTDTGWRNDYHNSKEIADVELHSVTKLGPNNYVAIFLTPLSDKMEAEFAQSPVGPWIGRTIVGQIEGQEDILAYFGVIHEETANNGVYTMSYSNNGSISKMLDDKTFYWPTYIKADLRSLSPFTTDNAFPVTLNKSIHGTYLLY
ncbi:MAG: carbohydrate binding domain-containing protein [Parafilimonas sp.]